MSNFNEPKFALVQEEGEKFSVEKFDASKHLTPEGWSYPGISLFVDPEEVSHLREYIIN